MDVARFVQTIETSQFSPPSPDPMGLTYLSSSNRLLASDGEVNEIPELFTGDNVFEFSLDGVLFDTLTTIPFSDEPAGLAFDQVSGHLFVSDDTAPRGIYDWNPGPDGIFDTEDDTTIFVNARDYDVTDPEGLAFDSAQGLLYLVDGSESEVYKIDPGDNGIFDGAPPAGDDLVTDFDTEILGVIDPEGITFDSDRGELYVIGRPAGSILQVTTEGTFVRMIDVSAAKPKKPSGLAYGPSSVDPSKMSIYIADRGVDNGSDPEENDGRIHEFVLSPVRPIPAVMLLLLNDNE